MPDTWKTVRYLRKSESGQDYQYEIVLPVPLADWDVYDYWERERTNSIASELTKSDVLYDIGAEHGWLSCVYAKTVGPDNIVLFEPTSAFWPNIRQTFEHNFSTAPKVCFNGLVDASSNGHISLGWPRESEGELIPKLAYEYIHQHTEGIQSISIDNFSESSGLFPTALTIDVEGAELLVLKGATARLADGNLKVWLSFHPDLAAKHYDTTWDDIVSLMGGLGYTGTHLATDHEEHWLFRKSQ